MSTATDEGRRCYDEMFDDTGTPRAITDQLLKRIGSFSLDQLNGYQKSAEIALRNMGITFNVYGHEQATERIWPFDVVPRILDDSEWLQIEKGLQQRIRALNLFVADLHGPQRILADGAVPRDLIFSAKTLRKACVGLSPPGGVWCHITGTDLIRDSDGQMYVLEDNLRCPSGASYVLENREVMKRTWPHVFSGLQILPVEDYPERLLETLISCAPAGVLDPTVVVLSPGMYNSAYFEHTFLAHQMGVKLVEGTDLFVDGDHVYMRTVNGQQRVDVIYRRIDDDFLDPACFREDSALGVKGLMEVYRGGRVTLANAPGTGVADDKAVYYYVPHMIKYYLGEEPLLPNVPTYLCSEDKERDHVLANLDKLVVKPTNESGGYGILMGPHASKTERAKFADLIRENPRNYVAQPMLTLSTVPTICEEGLDGRHVDLRPFILHGPEDIYVLPGGLTRVALTKGSLVVNSSQGGGSKDTWIVRNPHRNSQSQSQTSGAGSANGQIGQTQQLATGVQEDVCLKFGELSPQDAVLSRVAELIYWMSRYLERAENVARFVDVNHHLLLDAGADVETQWAPLIYALGDHDSFFARYEYANRENVLSFLTFDRENPNSILSCLTRARENARAVRGVISGLMWEEMNKLYLTVKEAADNALVLEEPRQLLGTVKLASHMLVGITDATMSHTQEWHFARLGRLLERADKTSRILDVKYFTLLPNPTEVGTPLDVVQWSSLLKSVSALTMYRKRHGRITPANVAGFLILEPDFPRSLHFCLMRSEVSVHAITANDDARQTTSAEELLGRLRAEMEQRDSGALFQTGLHQFVDRFQSDLNDVCDALAKRFFLVDPDESVAGVAE